MMLLRRKPRARSSGVRRAASMASSLLVLLVIIAADALGQANNAASGKTAALASDSAAVVATVEQFHRALADGDSLRALALMTDDVVVLESGGFESRAEFRSHHLPADIEFARATRSERQVRAVTVRGDAAWVSGTSTYQGEFRGRAINSLGAELTVLVRTPSGWRISAVHWSSRARRG